MEISGAEDLSVVMDEDNTDGILASPADLPTFATAIGTAIERVIS